MLLVQRPSERLSRVFDVLQPQILQRTYSLKGLECIEDETVG